MKFNNLSSGQRIKCTKDSEVIYGVVEEVDEEFVSVLWSWMNANQNITYTKSEWEKYMANNTMLDCEVNIDVSKVCMCDSFNFLSTGHDTNCPYYKKRKLTYR